MVDKVGSTDSVDGFTEEIAEQIWKDIKNLGDDKFFVPAKMTNYDLLEPRYYKLNKILKHPEKRKEWASRKVGRSDGKISAKELYELGRRDPVAYFVFQKGIILRPHQIKAIELMAEEDNKYVALCWGRRIGKSYVFRCFAEWSCMFNKHPVEGKGTKWSIILHSKEVGKEIYMEEVYTDIENGDITTYETFKGLLGDSFFSSFIITREDKTGQATGMKLSYKILADMSYENVKAYLASDAKAKKRFRRLTCSFKIMTKPRGIEGNVICDEIAFWKENNHLRDTHKVYHKGVRPIVTSDINLKCFISSTPDGMADIFYDLFDPAKKKKSNPFVKSWYPCWVRTDSIFTEQMNSLREEYIENGDLVTFQQEYEAKFVKSKDSFFDEEFHTQRIQDDKLSFMPSSTTNCDIIADWGGSNTSHTVIAAVSTPTDKEPSRLLYYHEYDINEDHTVVNDILVLTRKFVNWRWFICDNKGGNFAVKDIEKLLGDWKVKQFNFTTMKKDGYFAMKQAIRNDKLKIPVCDRIQEQMRNFTDKLKPNDIVISDDILDVIMMPTYYNSQVSREEYSVGTSTKSVSKEKPRTRKTSFANSNAWNKGAYGKY